MADDEKFLLVSLNENKAKKLAQIVSNDTCRKIIDLLSEKDYSESEISKKLKVPISTVHYNLKHLMKAGLITVDEFHYSKKGKEINHYKLANKYIIIAPKETSSIKDTLKKILPVGITLVVISAIIEFFNLFAMKATASFTNLAAPVQEAAMDTMVKSGATLANEAPRIATEAVPTATTSPSIWSHFSVWFLIGGIAVLLIYLFFEIIRAKISKK